MRVTCFGSGSSGNAMLVESSGTALLVDAGVTARRIHQGLAGAGLSPAGLAAVLVSHEHWDHVRALSSLGLDHACPVYATAGTAAALGAPARGWSHLACDATIGIGALSVTAIAIPHDAAEPVGFLIEDGEWAVSIFTDLGAPPPSLASPIGRAHLVVLESNYDHLMLARGRYPEHLKRRIRGPLGHLSNDDCGAFLSAGLDGTARDVWLAHLSENNNRPGLAVETVREHLSGRSAPRVTALPRRGGDVIWDSTAVSAEPRQLGLSL
ncbi:MAG TPA: MBL fold metallo-hydrolase [Thermomicrobiaceae bacterium]|nr:MBL fold metallo-hydrolase [Thermomicrobiaceae bacterium]